jgi:hypothetical protein
VRILVFPARAIACIKLYKLAGVPEVECTHEPPEKPRH